MSEVCISMVSQSTHQYTVRKGDNLTTIAKKETGSNDPKVVNRIYADNKDTIGKNPNQIQPGMVINVPDSVDEICKIDNEKAAVIMSIQRMIIDPASLDALRKEIGPLPDARDK